VEIKQKFIKVALKGKDIFIKGELNSAVRPTDSFWTLEDNKEVRIIMQKAKQHEVWKSLILSEHVLDPMLLQDMEKKMMLEKFQSENPGFDFSQAEFSGSVPSNPDFMRLNE